ncbi:MAG: MBOAT family protein [Fermentimonas sp.]|nr:MBOAT family protein [Fermentimonas sp.]
MVINSFSFLFFFTVLFVVYYFPLRNKTYAQNTLLLAASCVFYGVADLKMLPVLLISTVVFYLLGIMIQKSASKTASLLTASGVIAGVGMLFYFKYLNFFIDSFADLITAAGLQVNPNTLSIIFPLGISFFTFRLISYLIEINRGKIEPEHDFVAFAAFIAFFPTLLAGPIDRPNYFIPQLKSPRLFDYDLAMDGTRQVLWGMFKKMVIADNMGLFLGSVWGDVTGQNATTLLIAALVFPLQLYADFSGYSDMAIGVGKILGIRVAVNFRYPFFARNVAEYWRSWHMSLTSWVTDYVFMPLNVRFRQWGTTGLLLAIIINMIVIGIWHGANWTYAVFGLYHGLLFIPLVLSGSFSGNKKLRADRYGLPLSSDLLKMMGTYLLVAFGLIIFNAPSVGQAVVFVKGLFQFSNLTALTAEGLRMLSLSLFFMILVLIAEWKQRDKEYALQIDILVPKKAARFAIYWVLLIITVLFSGEEQIFIYMQF